MSDTSPLSAPAPTDPAELETLAMVAKAAADKAVAATDVPSWKPATVLEVVGNVATVHVDGDPQDVTIQAEVLASPTPYPQARVMVKFQPPSGAFVESWITRADPPGEVKMFATVAAPPGFLVCHGQAVSRSEYSALYEAIGTTWGSGDGTATFNVPNLKDTYLIGAGGAVAVGASAGANSVTLTTAQLPSHVHALGSHVHGVNHRHDLPSHGHSFSGSVGSVGTHSHSIATKYTSSTAHAHINTPGTASDGPEGGPGSSMSTGQAGGHGHTLSGSVGSTDPGFTGYGNLESSSANLGNSGAAGGGTSHENRPLSRGMLPCISY